MLSSLKTLLKRALLAASVTSLSLGATVALAGDESAVQKDDAKTSAADADLRKNLDELRSAMNRLTDRLGDKLQGDTGDASKWVEKKADAVSDSLRSASTKVTDKGDDAQSKAREHVVKALKDLGHALDGLAATDNKKLTAPTKSDKQEEPSGATEKAADKDYTSAD